MMRKKKFLKNISIVAVSNGLMLLASILIGIILPIIFSYDDYGYYRLFALYVTYFGLFHFGFIDGIYLHFGGVDYAHIESRSQRFRALTKFLLLLEFAVAVLAIAFALFFLEGDRRIVFILLGVNVIAINMMTYYQFISQVTSRFKEYSIRNIIYAILISISVLIIYLFKLTDYKVILLATILINYTLMFLYMHTYRNISFGKSDSISDSKNEIWYYFKLGFPLLIANLISVFMLNMSKQVVDHYFEINVFAIFSFAYSLMSFANIFVAAISTVVYPMLKQVEEDKLKGYYPKAV